MDEYKAINAKIDRIIIDVAEAKEHILETAKLVLGIEAELKDINSKYEAFSKRLKKVED